MKSAIDAVYRDVARSGADVHVARTHLVDFDVAAARFDFRRTRNLTPAHVSRTCLETHVAGEARHFQVARPAFEFRVAFEAFDNLIAAAGVGPKRGVFRDGDFVVDRNVVNVHVVDANAVPVLANGRIRLQLLHLRLVIAAEPGIARLNLGMNRNHARGAGTHGDVTRASQHFKIDVATDLERTVKGSDDRSEGSQRSSQNEDQRASSLVAKHRRVSHSGLTPSRFDSVLYVTKS